MIPRCAFGLTAFENSLYAFGGWVGEDIGGSIERYDPCANECNEYKDSVNLWGNDAIVNSTLAGTKIGNMEEPKFSMGICSYEG